jgi:uncharacterized membrane protein YebE (DUF533 family)
MANLNGILGSMLATGMAGRSRRGPSFASSPFGMGGSGRSMAAGASGGGFKQAAGIAALGYLAYKAYQQYQQSSPTRGEGAAGGEPASPQAGTSDGPSLGERLAGLLRPEQQTKPDAALDDEKALLLIRAMIGAANADGQISPDERQRILSRLQEAGASDEDRRFIEAELASPRPIDSLVADIRDGETAEQVYLASEMAIEPDSPAERSYLDYLAARLNLSEAQVRELRQAAQPA